MASDSQPIRSPHADVDIERRRGKARRILAVLDEVLSPGMLDLLEIGTGSGAMAEHFAATGRFVVASVDVVDVRVAKDGYDFSLIEGTKLPFPDGSFDVVVSNHVLEHVGERADQSSHMREIARVLRSDGVAYLATPNRWTLLEPHFRLPLLSWLPRRLSDPYVRMSGRGDHYDCRPVGPIVLSHLIGGSGLLGRHAEVEAVSKGTHTHAWVGRLVQFLGVGIQPLWHLSPTFVVLLKRVPHG